MKTPSKKIAIKGFESRLNRQDANVGYFEKWGEARIAHNSRAKIKVLQSGIFINARMRHYSESGVYSCRTQMINDHQSKYSRWLVYFYNDQRNVIF